MEELSLRWLGTAEISKNGQTVRSDRRKAVALLAYLSVETGIHRRDNLAALLWGEFDQTSALAYLRRTLWEITQLVGAQWILAERDKLSVPVVPGLQVDVQEFSHRIHNWKSKSGQPVETWIADVEAAADIYRGDFLRGFSLRDSPDFDTWQLNLSESLRMRCAEALQVLAEVYLQQGNLEAGLRIALRWVEMEPLNESAHCAVMRYYASSGQRGAAVRQFERCVEILQAELGVKPEAATKRLFEQIRSGDFGPRADAAPTAVLEKKPAPVTVHLPAVHTRFVGREEELQEVTSLLTGDECRLLTLTGPGGTGKTRLAIQAATRLKEHFPDGIFFVPLAPIENAESIVPVMANALGFSFRTLPNENRPPEDAQAQLVEYLRDKKLLLLTDNWEHLVGSSGILSELLGRAPRLKVLATSRERLNLGEEWLLEVRGLSFPTNGDQRGLDQFSAYRLFLQTALQRKPSFDPTPDDRDAISRICRLVEGVPLAIELAASWVYLLSCREILAELHRNLDFLSSSQRDLADRHRSLRAVFEHSWNLLKDLEQAVFLQLSVFQGGFTREAAEEVAGAQLPILAALVDKSLLYRSSNGRYSMHEMLKQYAAQKLSENGELARQVRERHFDYYNHWLLKKKATLTGARQKETVLEIRSEAENYRRAWEWGMANEKWALLTESSQVYFLYLNIGGRLATDFDLLKAANQLLQQRQSGGRDQQLELLQAFLLAYSYAHCMNRDQYEEGMAYFKQALKRFLPLPPSLSRAWGLLIIDFGVWELKGDQAVELMQESISLFQAAGEKMAHALSLNHWARQISFSSENSARAEKLLDQALQILQGTGDRWTTALILSSLARMINFRGDYQRSRGLLMQALETYEQLDDQWNCSDVRFILGQNATWLGRFDEARTWFQANLEFTRKMGYMLYHATNLDSLGYIEFLDQNYEKAEDYYQRSYALYRQAEDVRGMAIASNNLGDVARICQDWETAKKYYQESFRLIESEKDSFEMDTWIRSIIVKNMGRAALHDGDLNAAELHLVDALKMVRRIDRIPDILEIFIPLAEIDVLQGRLGEALVLLAFTGAHQAAAQNVQNEARSRFEQLAAELESERVRQVKLKAQHLSLDQALQRWIPAPIVSQPLKRPGRLAAPGQDFI